MKSALVNNPEFCKYNNALPKAQKDICTLLMNEIDSAFTGFTSKIFYGSPVWFIDDNPIVGYNAVSKGVSLLFWSGQSFLTPGLAVAGKFKAAKITFMVPTDIDLKVLRDWLKESVEIQWDYKNLRINGKLNRIIK